MRVLVTGAGGQVGSEVVEALDRAGHEPIARDRTRLDVSRFTATNAIEATRPDAIVHCAAYTAVDQAETERERAFRTNAWGTMHVAAAARKARAYLVALSTDYVFDGRKRTPYLEDDKPHPLGWYGVTTLAAERYVRPDSAVVRTSWVCGRTGGNMVKTILRLAEAREPLNFVNDQRGHPTIASDLATMLVRFVEEHHTGTWHVTNQGAVSWYEFAQEVLKAAGHDPERVKAVTTEDMPRPARRPANSVLANARLEAAEIPLLPDFRDSLPALISNLR